MRNEILQGDFKLFGRNYSDSDAKFVTKVIEAKARYMNPNVMKPPRKLEDGLLPVFGDDEKVAIVGDWGTGLRDAFDLL